MLPEKVKTHLSHPSYQGIPLTVRHVLKLESMYRPGHTLFRKWNVNPDVAIGIVGDRGTGKTISEGLISVVDYMMLGQPCYSNIKIAVEVQIDDNLEKLLREYEEFTGLPIERKPVRYEAAGDLDIGKLLSPYCDYYDGVIIIDEINIDMADSWRSMTNQALLSSDFMQLLRKLRSACIFSCISEMFVPNRVRDAVDIYIQTRDMAFINDSPLYGKPQGTNFQWRIFPMTGKLAGYSNTFDVLKKPYQTIRVHGRRCWGLVDTYERKKRAKHVNSLYDEELERETEKVIDKDALIPEVEEKQSLVDVKAEWGWLFNHPIIYRMIETGEEISRKNLLDELAEAAPVHLSKQEVISAFERYLNPESRYSSSQKVYSFSGFERVRLQRTQKVAVPV